eukprot:scaffold15772_cov162-Cylindrotheca_fusiformis.AAC.2
MSVGFSPTLQRSVLSQRYQEGSPMGRLFSSQWDDEEEEVAVDERKSFADAGEALQDEEDQKKMDGMGDFDANPAKISDLRASLFVFRLQYNSEDINRVRDAIRQRTQSLGIEKSKISMEAIQAAEERAKSGAANSGESSFQQLDLSKITSDSPRGKGDNVPAMFFDAEEELTEEEMAEADPDGQLSLKDQALKEIGAATWPTPVSALKEVVLLIAVVAFTAALIINWDNFLRELYTSIGLIPSEDDLMKGAESLVLPEGWTNGMSEEDLMNFQDEVGKSVTAAPAGNGFPEL